MSTLLLVYDEDPFSYIIDWLDGANPPLDVNYTSFVHRHTLEAFLNADPGGYDSIELAGHGSTFSIADLTADDFKTLAPLIASKLTDPGAGSIYLNGCQSGACDPCCIAKTFASLGNCRTYGACSFVNGLASFEPGFGCTNTDAHGNSLGNDCNCVQPPDTFCKRLFRPMVFETATHPLDWRLKIRIDDPLLSASERLTIRSVIKKTIALTGHPSSVSTLAPDLTVQFPPHDPDCLGGEYSFRGGGQTLLLMGLNIRWQVAATPMEISNLRALWTPSITFAPISGPNSFGPGPNGGPIR